MKWSGPGWLVADPWQEVRDRRLERGDDLIADLERHITSGLAGHVRDEREPAIQGEPRTAADRLDADDTGGKAVPRAGADRAARDDDVVRADAEERKVVAERGRLGGLDVLVCDPQERELVRRAFDARGKDVLDADERRDLGVA